MTYTKKKNYRDAQIFQQNAEGVLRKVNASLSHNVKKNKTARRERIAAKVLQVKKVLEFLTWFVNGKRGW